MLPNISQPIQYLLCFSIAAMTSFLFMPQIYRIADKVRAIDDPSVSARKIHTRKIPRLGGLAIYIAFLLTYAIMGKFVLESNYSTLAAGVFSEQMESILIASFFIVLMGIFDDISSIKPWKKFLIQILAAIIVVFRGDFVVNRFDFIIDIKLPGYVGQIFTVLWIVTITNAINLSDGLDGLAGGISFISLATMIAVAFLDPASSASTMVIMICLILAGAIFGFLPFNLPPARIFMGDSGAQFIGFMIGTLSVFGYKQAAFTSFFVPVVILAVPLFDTIFAFGRRLSRNVPASAADANHIHHRVFHKTDSSKYSLYWIYGMSALFSLSAILYSYDKRMGLAIFIVTFIVTELFLEYFHVISVRYTPLLNLYYYIFPSPKREEARKKKILQTLRYQHQQKKQVDETVKKKKPRKKTIQGTKK